MGISTGDRVRPNFGGAVSLGLLLLFLSIALPLHADSPRVTLNLQNIEIRELIRILGQQAGVSIYADPSISGTASLNVENLAFLDALKAIVEPRGYSVQRISVAGDAASVDTAVRTGSIRYLVYDPAVARRIFVEMKDGFLTVDIQRFQLSDVLSEIARESKRSIVPSVDATASITLSLNRVPFERALVEIVRSAGFALSVEGEGDSAVYRVVSAAAVLASPDAVQAAQGPMTPYEVTLLDTGRIRVRATDAPLKAVLLAVGKAGGISIVVGEEITATSTAYLDAVTPEEAVTALATLARLRILKEGPVTVVSTTTADRLVIRAEDGTMRVDAYEASVREALTRIAVAGRLPALTFDESVDGTVSIHLGDLAPRHALEKVASARGLRLEERGDVIRITDPAKERRVRIIQQAGLLSFDIQNASLADVVREIGSRTGINITAPRGDTPVTLAIQSLPAPAAIRALADATGLAAVAEADRFRLAPLGTAPRGIARAELIDGRLTIECSDAEIALVARELAAVSGRNFVVETGVSGAVTGRVEGVEFDAGIRTFLASKGYRLRRSSGIYRITSGTLANALEPAPNFEVVYENSRLTVDVTDADLGALLRQVAEEAGYDLALYGAVRDKVNVILRDESIETALAKILAGTRFGYMIRDSTLTIGDISQPGPMAALALREELIPLQYFSAKEIPPLLPAEIPAAQIKVVEAQNAILVTGRPEIIDRTRSFIANLDRRPTQIQIEGLLVEYRNTDAFTYNLSALTVTGVSPDIATLAPSGGAGTFTVTDLRNFNNPMFQASLTALVEKNEAVIRARPSIATISGREARINVQSQENFRVTQPSSTQGVPLVQIQSINSGITLRITPYVASDAGDAVTIDIFFEDSSPGDRTSDGLPAIATRSAQNRIVLRGDRTAVIGGLIRNDVSKSRGGFPLLTQIPVIGSLFGRRLSTDRQSTLVFYITPRLITSDTTVAESFQERGARVESEALNPPMQQPVSAPPTTVSPSNAI